MTPADLIQIGLNHQRIRNGSLRKGNLPGRIWHGLGGNSVGTVAIKKMTPIRSNPSIATQPTVLPEQRVEYISLTKRMGYQCMYLPLDMKKLALITIKGNGLSIAFGNPKKQ